MAGGGANPGLGRDRVGVEVDDEDDVDGPPIVEVDAANEEAMAISGGLRGRGLGAGAAVRALELDAVAFQCTLGVEPPATGGGRPACPPAAL
jgi:hypothetical protein